MAAGDIRRVFFNPPVAVARLGGSTTPLDAFDWGPGDPHTTAETRIRPAWSLAVGPGGTVTPFLPTTLDLRDGPLLRPLAPFLELWAMVEVSADEQRPAPLTLELLERNGATPADVRFVVRAVNAKAARRTGRDELRFGTFPALEVIGDDHRRHPLLGSSPPGVTTPMISRGRFVPLGAFQVMAAVAQPAEEGRRWPDDVRTDVVRVRFTPAAGRFYGPPEAAGTDPPAVPRDCAFLEAAGGWYAAQRYASANMTMPADTFDALDESADPVLSLGVVDDTCDAVVSATVALRRGTPAAAARVSVGPPHYAPDRRPFLSLADEINDREHDPTRDTALAGDQSIPWSLAGDPRTSWVEDLFERIFETVSQFDLDFWRTRRRNAKVLSEGERREQPIPGDGVPREGQAMGGFDRLRDGDIAIPAPSPAVPLTLTQRAREQHRRLSDASSLAAWIRAHPGRLQQLVRPPLVSRTSAEQTMQMPPFMRNSNAGALSLSRWQYDLLMEWTEKVEQPDPGGPVAAPGVAAPGPSADGASPEVPLSARAAARREHVLAQIDGGRG